MLWKTKETQMLPPVSELENILKARYSKILQMNRIHSFSCHRFHENICHDRNCFYVLTEVAEQTCNTELCVIF